MATEENHSATATATATATTDKKEMEQDIVVSSTKETTNGDKNLGDVSNPGLSQNEQIETHVVDTKETVEPEKKSPVVVESVEKDGKSDTPELPVASETKDQVNIEPVEPKEANQVQESHEIVQKDVQETDGEFDKRIIEQPVVEDVSGEPQLTTSKVVDVSDKPVEVKEEQVEPTEENPVEEKPQEASEQSEAVSAEAKATSETGFNPQQQSEAAGHVGGANESETETKIEPDVQTVNVKEVLVEKVENSVTDVKSSELEAVPEKETEEVVLSKQEPIPEKETKEAEKEQEISKEKDEVNEEPKQTTINNDAAEEKFIVEEKNCKDVEPAANGSEKAVETKPEVEETEISAKEGPEVESKEVHVKPASKHSNIMSKVKQSFVKAKKAIIGKSQSSKTMSAEAKGEIKVK